MIRGTSSALVCEEVDARGAVPAPAVGTLCLEYIWDGGCVGRQAACSLVASGTRAGPPFRRPEARRPD